MNKKLNKKVVPFLILAQIMATSGLSYAAPDEIHAFTTMKKWDYHRTNYDKDGNIRYKPKSVQFSTENEGTVDVDNRIPKLSSEDTEYGKNVEVIFDASTAEAKQWQANIYRVVKQNPYSEDPNSVQDVVYKVEDGKITLYADSRAIDYNGEHLIKIYSTGYDTVKGFVHIVKEGTIRIHGNYEAIEGEDLLFELLDFNYGITNPIYEVLLDGEALKGDCEEYHVVSNLIRLENEAHSKLTKGKHKITVRAKGYKDVEKEFIVKENNGLNTNPVIDHEQEIKTLSIPVKINAQNIDTISSASTEPGGNADTVSGASGSLDTQANLVFDFDLVSNAQILRELGMETENSKKVLDIWNSVDKDAASKDGKMITWGAYTNAVMDAKVKGEYITFEEYMNSPDAEEYKNRPYNVKYVLEDGAYGEVQPFAQIDLKDVPSIEIAKAKLGQDIELTSNDSEWKNNIEYIRVGSTQLFDSEYEVKDEKIMINGDRFIPENNEIIIVSKGYKDAKVNVSVEKSSINLSIDPDTNKTEQNINVLGITEDFAQNIDSVRLNGKELLSQEAVGSGAWGYRVQSNKVVLNKDLFNDENQQTLIIKSYGYGEQVLQFKLEQGNVIVDPQNDVVPTAKTTQGILGEDVVITWENDNPKWRDSVTQVYVRDMIVTGDKYALDNGKITIKSSVFSQGSNKVVIKAENYIDLQVTQDMVTNTPNFTVTEANTSDGIKISVPVDQFGWIDDIAEIKVDNVAIESEKYKKEALSIVIDKEVVSQTKDYKVEVLADGYKKAEFNIAVKDFNKPFTGVKESAITLNASQENKLGKDVEITFVDNQEFRTSIQDITINDVKVAEEKVEISKGKIAINKDLFQEENTYTIKIVAYGYEDAQVSQEIGSNTQEPGGLLTPPSLDDIDYIKKTERLTIQASDWTNNINKIVVNGSTLSKGVDYYTDSPNSNFIIKGSAFDTVGETTVVFSADGYKELTIKIIVQNPKEVPAQARIQGDSEILTGNDVVIDLSQVPFEMNGYKVDEVYLGEEKLSGDSKVSISSVNVTVKGKNFNKPGNYKIILKASGYEDKEFNITVTGQEIPQTNYDAPQLISDTVDNYLGKDIEITFNDNSGWINNIEEIKIKDISLSSSDLNKVKKEAGKLTFPSALFNAPGTCEIEIIADGFKNITVTQEIKKVAPAITTNLSDKTVNSDAFKFTVDAADSVSGEKIVPVVKLDNVLVAPNSGTIEYEVTLKEGDNSISIDATDTDGLKSSESCTVRYEKTTEPEQPEPEKEDVPSSVELVGNATINKGDKVKIKIGSMWLSTASNYKSALDKGEVVEASGSVNYEIKKLDDDNYYVILSGDNFNAAKEYTIKLKAEGYKEKEFKVTVNGEGSTPQPQEDTEKPVIALNGESSVNVENGAAYNDTGVTITDNKDNNLTPTITYTKDGGSASAIDTSASGTYTIHYNVEDAAGNDADEVTRTVIVKEAVVQGGKDAPSIESRDENYSQWGSVSFKIETRDEEWESKITEFIFEGNSYSKDENYKIEDKGMFTEDWNFTVDKRLFPHTDGPIKYIKKGTYNMTIKSDGYKDVNISIEIQTN